MHKKLIKEIVEKGNTSDMEYLEEIMNDLLCELKDTNYTWYKNIELEMYKRLYGNHLNEDLARKWVNSMDNKDGTKGQHWTIEQTNPLAENLNRYDFYAVLNMMWSDYYNPKFDTNTYIELAKDWINDSDVGDCKTLMYYFYVVKQ